MALVVVGGFITGGPGARPACGQDILGIYFDPDGTVTSVTTSSPFETVTGYLLIVEPTEPSGVSGWECAVEIVTATGPLAASWTLNGLALNIDTPPSFQVGLADPLPGSQAVLLATCEVVVPDPGDEVEFYVHCHDPPSIPNPPGGQCVPAYAAGDDPAHLIPLGWPDGCDMLPVAVINDDQIAPLMGPTLDPASLDFGEVNVGDSAVETILVGNDFAHSLRGTARVEGDHYRIRRGIDPFGTEVEYELLPGHSFVMDVRFAPPAGGVYAAAIDFWQCDQVVRTLPVTGVGGAPECSVSPDTLVFGAVPVGQHADAVFTIQNVGNGILVGYLYWSSNDFEVLFTPSGSSFSLAAGESRDFIVRFAPTAFGPLSFTIQINEPTEDLCPDVFCSGVGGQEGQHCQVEPAALDFGEVTVGFAESRSFTITNSGTETLPGEVPAGAGDFTVTEGAGPFELAPGGNLPVTVQFAPAVPGEQSWQIDLGDICTDVSCQGTGLEAIESCVVFPASLQFGQVSVGGARVLSFRILNDGTAQLEGEVTLDREFFSLTSGGGPYSLAPGHARWVSVLFSPGEPGEVSCLVQTGNQNCAEVPCTGSGVEGPGPPGDEDVVGIYFDPEGYANQYWTTGAPEIVTAYLLLLNASQAGGVAGWELCAEITGDMFVLSWNLNGQAINCMTPPCFAVGLATPLPWSPAILLMSIDILQLYTDSTTLFYIQPSDIPSIPGYPAYAAGDNPGLVLPMFPSSGASDLPVAYINGGPAVGLCGVSEEVIDFGQVAQGESQIRSFYIYNPSDEPLSGDVQASCEFFDLAYGGGPFTLPPGGHRQVGVQYQPGAPGVHTCQVTTGNPDCPEVTCLGECVPVAGEEDVVGIYFDLEGQICWHWTGSELELVTAYLLLLNPSQPGGVSGWECQIEIDGEVIPVAWNICGSAINAASPPEFAVGLSVPLPWAEAVQLISFDFFQLDWQETLLYIHPLSTPTIPGYPAYICPDYMCEPVPMLISSGSEFLPVAWVNPDPLHMQAPPPRTTCTVGGVELSWSYDPAVADGCFLYRRLEGEAAERLTETPLSGPGGRIEYTDHLFGLADGAVLHYCYSLVRQGREIGRSQEVPVTLSGVTPAATALRPNYPNPFNPVTHLEFELARAGRVELVIFDLAGRRIRTLADLDLPAGVHERQWDGRDENGRPVPSGVYYCRLRTAQTTSLQKMMLLK